MRHITWWAAAPLTLLVIGCGGSGSNAPVLPTSENPIALAPESTTPPALSASGSLGTPSQQGLLATSALAIYTIDLDPAALTATSRLKETRTGQANDDLYLLSIDSFLNAGSFKISSVSADATTIDLGYVVTHPFPAPNNVTGTPNGSTNRADLGIAGMVLFLTDVASASGNTYFTDRIADTSTVTNADAYYSPGGLLTVGGTANTFPYRQLVDETTGGTGSREGISNGGNVTGNFGSDGWTRSEFGAGNNGWTGYGVLHQGQASASSVSLSKNALTSGFSLDVAIIAKYNDPRGGATPAQKKANRLPPATADASLFAYRMPHGALDAGKIVVADEPAGFIANTISSAQISLHVDDWDARATETAAADLSEDPSFTNVAAGESGAPTVEVCIPGVLGDASTIAAVPTVVDDDSAYGGDAGQDSGAAGDPLFFSALVTKGAGTGQTAGDFTGLVRVTDPETGLVIGLDGNLLPLGTPPPPITYQSFTVTQLPDNAPPSATVILTTGANLLSGLAPAVTINAIADADSDPLDISIDWGDGLGFQPLVTGITPPYANQSPTGPQMNNIDLTPDPISIVVRLDDGSVEVDYPLNYTLGPNRPPQVTGNRALQTSSLITPASFTMNAGTGTAVDPEGDAISYTITNSRNSDQPTFVAFPNAANTTPIATIGPVNFTVYANDALHPTTSGTAYPVVAGTVLPAGPIGFLWAPTTQLTGAEQARGIAVSPMGNIYVICSFQNNTDFGGGPLSSALTPKNALVALDATGSFLWNRNLGTPTSAWVDTQGVGADAAGNAFVYGYWRQTMDFGFGPETNNTSVSTSNYDTFMCKYSPTGTPLFNARSNGDGTSTGITDFQEFNGLSVDAATGDVAITGKFSRTETWGAHSVISSGGPTSTNQDHYIVRISNAGTPLWARTFVAPNTGNESGMATAFTPTGDVIVGGYYRALCDFGGGPRGADTSGDGFVARLNGTTGAWVWDYVFDGTGAANQEFVNAVAADGSRVYATGRFYNTTDFGGGIRTAGGGTTVSDPFVVALDLATGAYVWDRAFVGSTSSEQGRGVAVSATGVYVTGEWFANADFGAGPATPGGSSDIYLLKLVPATGSTIWSTLVGGSGADLGRSVGVTSGDDPVIAGSYSTTFDFDPGTGVTTGTAVGSSDAFVAKYLGGTGTIF